MEVKLLTEVQLILTQTSALQMMRLCSYYRPQGKVMFSQASVIPSHNRPHGYSFTAHPCYGAGGMHPTGMHSCFNQQFPIYDILRNGNFCLRHESSW